MKLLPELSAILLLLLDVAETRAYSRRCFFFFAFAI